MSSMLKSNNDDLDLLADEDEALETQAYKKLTSKLEKLVVGWFSD